MPNDLYDRDVLAWSEHQADLLRRLARGERVNDVDWDHVVEEIADVGQSELHAVESYLDLLLVHLLKARAWPTSDSLNHWHAAIVAFQNNAARRFAPSMRQRVDLQALYLGAVEQVAVLNGRQSPAQWPEFCPFTLDQLLTSNWTVLKDALANACTA